MKVEIVSEKGPKPRMEDTFSLEKKDGALFCGVYDGHNGAYAAKYTKKNLHKKFFERLDSNPEEAFRKSYIETSNELSDQSSGTTAVTFYKEGDEIIYANVGDSLLFIFEEDGFKQLTPEHRVEQEKERKRIKENGGQVSGHYSMKQGRGLMPTRTIGDEFFKDIGIIAEPETGKYQLKEKDKWILVATDGLFDFINPEEINDVLEDNGGVNKTAGTLRDKVLKERGGSDNLTFILIKL